MIATIYPSECLLMFRDDICARWVEHRFVRRPTARQLTEAGYIKVRTELDPIRVKATLARLTPDGRLLRLSNGNDYDAGTILLMARIGKHGMQVLPHGQQEQASSNHDQALPAEGDTDGEGGAED